MPAAYSCFSTAFTDSALQQQQQQQKDNTSQSHKDIQL
jgi:hypothetical protein